MNQKQKAINCIIKAMRKQSKAIGCMIEFTEDNEVILSDTYAFIIAPLHELSSKDKERINKLYKNDIFNKKEVIHRIKNSEYTHKFKFLMQFLDDKFLSKKYTIKLTEKFIYDDKIVYYDGDNVALTVSTIYKDLLHYPTTYDNIPMRYNLALSNIDNITCGVLPLLIEEKKGR